MNSAAQILLLKLDDGTVVKGPYFADGKMYNHALLAEELGVMDRVIDRGFEYPDNTEWFRGQR